MWSDLFVKDVIDQWEDSDDVRMIQWLDIVYLFHTYVAALIIKS